eukprot:c22617_g1_i2 orf=556-2184(-)
MGKEFHVDGVPETEMFRQSIDTELSFSRWNRNSDTEAAYLEAAGSLLTVGRLDTDLEFVSRESAGTKLPKSLGTDKLVENFIDRLESIKSADPIRHTVFENEHISGTAPTQEFSFDNSKEIDVVSDEDFEREFGLISSDIQPGSETLQKAAKSIGLNVFSQVQEFKHFDEDMQSAPVSGAMDRTFVIRTAGRALFYVLVWYTFSTSLTLYNKELLGADLGRFPAPLLMNTIHFSMQAVISTLMLQFCCHSLRPPVRMSWRDYFLRVFPLAIATALDINFSNVSFVSISVTFATMCKSAAPVFLLLFAFLFKLEAPSFKLLGIIAIISVGILLTVTKETQFNLGGFILVMLAAVMSGFRWTVMQILLQNEEYGLSNPFAAMQYLTPIMAIVTGMCSIATEPWRKLGQTHYFDSPLHIFGSSLLMLLGGSLAFFMVLAEYLLISETSALTLMVAGIVKEVVTIVVAIFFFHDSFTVSKAVGLVIIIFGISLFNWYKYQRIVEGKLSAHHLSSPSTAVQSSANYTILTEETSILELGEMEEQNNV